MGPLLDTSQHTAQTASDFGLALLQAVLALIAVSVLAWLSLRFAAKRGLGLGGIGRGKLVQVEERLSLDLKNGLVVVRVEQRRLLLATSDRGPARLLTELSPPSEAASDAASRARDRISTP